MVSPWFLMCTKDKATTQESTPLNGITSLFYKNVHLIVFLCILDLILFEKVNFLRAHKVCCILHAKLIERQAMGDSSP